MSVSGGDIFIDSVDVARMDELLEVLATLSRQLEGLATLSLRISNQIDLIFAVSLTTLICAICYIILNRFTRF